MASRSALLIATYDYQDTGLRRLTAPAHDAEALAEVLSATLAWPSAAIAVRGSLAWYVGTLAFVALAAGAGVLHPRTRAAAGPGAVIGAAAACIWGLGLFAQLLAEPYGTKAIWVTVAGHVTLLAAAYAAVLTLYRDGAVKIALRRPGSRLTWVLAAVAGVSTVIAALALTGELYRAARLDEVSHNFWLNDVAWCYLAAAVLAVAVPAAAAVAMPRRLGRWLLGGWAAVSAGIWLTTVLPGRQIVGLGTGYIIALGSARARQLASWPCQVR